MLVGVLNDQNTTSNELLPVQRAGSVRKPGKPQVLMDRVESWGFQVKN